MLLDAFVVKGEKFVVEGDAVMFGCDTLAEIAVPGLTLSAKAATAGIWTAHASKVALAQRLHLELVYASK